MDGYPGGLPGGAICWVGPDAPDDVRFFSRALS